MGATLVQNSVLLSNPWDRRNLPGWSMPNDGSLSTMRGPATSSLMLRVLMGFSTATIGAFGIVRLFVEQAVARDILLQFDPALSRKFLNSPLYLDVAVPIRGTADAR